MKTNLLLAASCGLLLALSSCDKANDDPKPGSDAKPITLKPEYKTRTVNYRSFALDLFQTTVAESAGKNVFISPYSVNMSLNMAWNGAAGETAEQMGIVLGNATYTREQINDYSKTLTEALQNADPSTQLKIANSIWADNKHPFLPTFVQANKTWYNAEVKNVDFSKAETLKQIDKWVLDNTNKKIDNITEGMSGDTKFALVNAIYFKGIWRNKFKTSDTKKEPFTTAGGKRVDVDMMNMENELLYSDDDKEWKMLRLSYGNYAFSMVLLMPYADEPLDEKLPSLTPEKFYELFETVQDYPVTLKLPRFSAEYSYELQDKTLPAMGIELLFDPNTADLSEMCQTPMYVDLVKHKTFIEVDEKGTEAAASTSSSGGVTSPAPGTHVNFFADRPFVYTIVENSTGTILFMGRINNF